MEANLSAHEIIEGLLKYAEQHPEINNEPSNSDRRTQIERAKAFLEKVRTGKEMLKPLKDAGLLTFGDCVAIFGDNDSDPYVAAARARAEEGELEIDNPTVVSRGDSSGAYVMGWIWVSNGSAGVEANSELLELVLEGARQTLESSHHGLDAETQKLRSVQADWLEDLISNFADELDDIEDETPKAAPGPVTWQDSGLTKCEFRPSEALGALLNLAQTGGLNQVRTQRAAVFNAEFGEKLDALLTALPIV